MAEAPGDQRASDESERARGGERGAAGDRQKPRDADAARAGAAVPDEKRQSEAASEDDGASDRHGAPAGNEDQLVRHVLFGAPGEHGHAEPEHDERGEERVLDRGRDAHAGGLGLHGAAPGGDGHQTFSTSGRPRMPDGMKISAIARMENAATSL